MKLSLLVVAVCAFTTCGAEIIHIVALSRHGVRSPYPPEGKDLTRESLQPYSDREFPVGEDWGISGTAQLTPHGGVAVTRHGEWFASMESYKNVVSECGRIAMYSDIDQRDIDTAESFLAGINPSCDPSLITTHSYETIFNQGGYITDECKLATKNQTLSLVGGSVDAAAFTGQFSYEINMISDLIGCCNTTVCHDSDVPNATCSISQIPVKYEGEFFKAFSGPVATAGYFGSFFFLEGLNNMTIAWGEVSLEEALHLYQMELAGYDIVDNFWSARSLVSHMAAFTVASLVQAARNTSVANLPHSPNTSLTFLAGHDLNIVLWRKLLQLEWVCEGWVANNPGPGGMLLFELHHDPSTPQTPHYVKMFFEISTPEQIRDLTQFGLGESGSPRPSRCPVAIPGCTGDGLACELSEFVDVVLGAVESECVHDHDLFEFVKANEPDDDCGDDDLWYKWGLGGLAVGLVFAALVFGVYSLFCDTRKKLKLTTMLIDE